MVYSINKMDLENEHIYSFNGYLKESFPSQVMMDIAEVCNLGCIHCAHPKFKKSDHYAKSMLDPELNRKMVDEVATHGQGLTKYIRYTSNGEPLVHPKSYEMINYAVDHSKTKVTLTTNGTLLNEKKMNRLLDSGIHMIDVSLDAFTNETYKIIRVGGDLVITKKNVLRMQELIQINNYNTKLVVSFIEQKQNSHEIKDFYNFWKNEIGVQDVVIRRLHTNAGVNLDLGHQKGSKRKPCLYPWERIILNAKGKLGFCPTDWFGQAVICDYKENTIKDIWNSDFYKILRNQHKCNDFKDNLFCKGCPDWANTSWPKEEKKAYADLVEKILYEEK